MARVRQSIGRTASTGRDLSSNHPTMVVYFESRHQRTPWPEMVVRSSPSADPPAHSSANRLRIVPAPDDPPGSIPVSPPLLAAPGLVAVAAMSIMEGYRWLNVIPAHSLHPSAYIYVALAVPLLVACTRPQPDRPRGWVRRAAVAASLALGFAALAETVINRPWSARAFGVCDLAVAAVAIGAAWVINRSDHLATEDAGRPKR